MFGREVFYVGEKSRCAPPPPPISTLWTKKYGGGMAQVAKSLACLGAPRFCFPTLKSGGGGAAAAHRLLQTRFVFSFLLRPDHAKYWPPTVWHSGRDRRNGWNPCEICTPLPTDFTTKSLIPLRCRGLAAWHRNFQGAKKYHVVFVIQFGRVVAHPASHALGHGFDPHSGQKN